MPERRQSFSFILTEDNVGVSTHRLAAYKQQETESRQIEDPFQEQYGAQGGLVEPPYNPAVLSELPDVNAYHYQSCWTKAHDSAGLGWSLEGDVGEASKTEVEEFFDGQRPTLSISLVRAMYDYESIGWGAMEVVREGHDPEARPEKLLHIPAHTLRIHKDRDRFAQIRGSKRQWFKRFGLDQDVRAEDGSLHDLGSLPADERGSEVLWWVNYTNHSDYYGQPDVISVLGVLQGELSRRDYNLSFFDHFGVPAYAVTITGDFDPGDPVDSQGRGRDDPESEPPYQTQLEWHLEEQIQELIKNPHSILVISIPSTGDPDMAEAEVQVNFEPLSTDVKDSSFRMFRKDNRDEILVAHGVPPYRIGIAETGSLGGSTARESTEIYKSSVVNPRQEIVESIFSRDLILEGFEVEGLMFNLADIDTRDRSEDVGLLVQVFAVGAVTPLEIKRYLADHFNLDVEAVEDDPAMNQHYVDGLPITGGGAETPADAGEQALAVVKAIRDDLAREAFRSKRRATVSSNGAPDDPDMVLTPTPDAPDGGIQVDA